MRTKPLWIVAILALAAMVAIAVLATRVLQKSPEPSHWNPENIPPCTYCGSMNLPEYLFYSAVYWCTDCDRIWGPDAEKWLEQHPDPEEWLILLPPKFRDEKRKLLPPKAREEKAKTP